MHGNKDSIPQSRVRATRACYFLLNYANFAAILDATSTIDETCYFLLNYACRLLYTLIAAACQVPCYFLLNYAFSNSLFFACLTFANLLFSFELCWEASWDVGGRSCSSACYFLLNYAQRWPASVDVNSGPTPYNHTACYFLLNYAITIAISIGYPDGYWTCYFLLNYAPCNKASGRVWGVVAFLLFSFELCWASSIDTKRGWENSNLLFSFELCPFSSQ